MQHFDLVARAFLREPAVYRVFVQPDRLCFVYIGNILRVDASTLSELQAATPEELLARDPRCFSLARCEIRNPELFSSHFLLGHGLFWQFRTTDGHRRLFVLHQWGDMNTSAAMLCRFFSDDLASPKLNGEMRDLVKAASEEAKRLPPLGAGREAARGEVRAADSGNAAPAPQFQNWQATRTRLVELLLFIAILVGLLLKYGCDR